MVGAFPVIVKSSKPPFESLVCSLHPARPSYVDIKSGWHKSGHIFCFPDGRNKYIPAATQHWGWGGSCPTLLGGQNIQTRYQEYRKPHFTHTHCLAKSKIIICKLYLTQTCLDILSSVLMIAIPPGVCPRCSNCSVMQCGAVWCRTEAREEAAVADISVMGDWSQSA